MAAPTKYVDPISFSFRANSNEWEDFKMALRFEKKTPTTFFTQAMRKYLKEKQPLILSVKMAIEDSAAEPDIEAEEAEESEG